MAEGVETTPLLGNPDLSSSSPIIPSPTRKDIFRPGKLHAHFSKWAILYLCGLVVFLADFGTFMGEGARLRMLELGVCREYYISTDPRVIRNDGSIPEELCKLDQIQSELARMRGFLGLLENLPGLILAVPYGILASKRGRKLVAFMAIVGLIGKDIFLVAILYFYKTFPLRTVYAAPAFVLIGGGTIVVSATILAMVASSIAEEHRTKSFLYLSVTVLVSELLSPPLGSALMDTVGPYLTFIAGFPILILGLLVLSFTTEDDLKKGDDNEGHLNQSSNSGIRTGVFLNRAKHLFTTIFVFIRQQFSSMSIVRDHTLLVGIFSLAAQKLARPMLDLLLQYMSKRFRWKVSKTVYIISLQAAFQIVLFVWVVPTLYQWLLRHSDRNATRANLKLARICIIFLTLGSLLVACAPVIPIFILAVIVYTCGTGFAHAMRAFLTSFVRKDQIAILYTTMAVVEGFASILASPILGLAFSVGITWGGTGIALPFFIAASLYSFAGAGVWSIRLTQRGYVDLE